MAITKGINHVGLSVTNVEASKDFFIDILGFNLVKHEAEQHAFVTDGSTLITLWQTAESKANIKAAGLHHLAFQVESTSDLRDVETKLRQQNYRIQFDGMGIREKEGGFIALFFYDPSGIRIELATKEKDEVGDIPIIGGCGEWE